jgi:dihydroorotase
VDRFVAMASLNPARLLGLAAGTLAVGAPADITIFADRSWTVDAKRFFSKGKNTPFDGMTLPRRAVTTIVAGNVAYHDGAVIPHAVLAL